MVAPAGGRRTSVSRSGTQIVSIVVGALAALLALALVLGGGVLVTVHATQRDADGFYSSGSKMLVTPTHAVIADGFDVGTDAPDWLFSEGRLATVRFTATGPAAKPVFIGIARSADVDAYLGAVERDVISDFEIHPFSVTYDRHAGALAPREPSAQTFWVAAAHGTGAQTVTWTVEEGAWDIVVMNADGASGIRAGVTIGAKVPFIIWLGVALLAGGGLVAVSAGVAIWIGTRPHLGGAPEPV